MLTKKEILFLFFSKLALLFTSKVLEDTNFCFRFWSVNLSFPKSEQQKKTSVIELEY